jgi:tripartite-type tricarboxylate transporter receptor subunit TctC
MTCVRLVGVVTIAMTAIVNVAKAQTFPSRDITFIVPYAPGGSTDPISRQFSAQLEKILKTNIIVENKPGGSATIGTGAIIKAAADGYTIGLGSNASLMYQPLTKKDLPWRDVDDFQPVVKLVDLPAVLSVRADAPWRTYEQFLADVRENPGKIRASVSGLRTAPDLVTQQLNKMAGVHIRTVPFTGGGAEALLALLGGRVEANVGYGPSIKGQVDAGQVRVLAVFQRGKYRLFPEARSIGDTEHPATLAATYYVIAPKGLPPDVQKVLLEASKRAVQNPDFIKFAEDNGYTVDAKTGLALRAELKEYKETFADLITFLDRAKN